MRQEDVVQAIKDDANNFMRESWTGGDGFTRCGILQFPGTSDDSRFVVWGSIPAQVSQLSVDPHVYLKFVEVWGSKVTTLYGMSAYVKACDIDSYLSSIRISPVISENGKRYDTSVIGVHEVNRCSCGAWCWAYIFQENPECKRCIDPGENKHDSIQVL